MIQVQKIKMLVNQIQVLQSDQPKIHLEKEVLMLMREKKNLFR
jgi:hypothetical protein